MNASESHNGSFEVFHRRYEQEVFSFMNASVTEEEASDLTIETFVSLYRAWSRKQANPSVSDHDWMMAVAQFVRDNYLKAKRRQLKQQSGLTEPAS